MNKISTKHKADSKLNTKISVFLTKIASTIYIYKLLIINPLNDELL